MPLAARVLMAALAAFGVWTMIRACRSGTIYSEGSGYNIDERPVTFSLTLVAHGLGVAFLLWLAAGYDAPSFMRLFGLDPVRWGW
jgi:hypothetical protein